MKVSSSSIVNFILGDLQHFSVNNRTYNALNAFFAFFCIAIAMLSFKKLNIHEDLIFPVLSVGFGILFFRSRWFKRQHFWFFLIYTQLLFTVILYFSNGLNGYGIFLFIISYAAYISISEKEKYWLIFLLIGLHLATLLTVNYFFPKLFLSEDYPDVELKWIFISVIFLSIGFIINSLKFNYSQNSEQLKKEKEETAALYENVRNSINYAFKIQQALLPDNAKIEKLLPQSFIFYQPRDIVSGDFFWVDEVENKTIVIESDCTGHGVPGAFMSMLGISLLNEIILNKKVIKANEILNQLRSRIKLNIPETNDGMDMSVVIIDKILRKIEYAGANSPLFMIRNGELIEYNPNHQPVGLYTKEKDFDSHEIVFEDNDIFYIFSDGYRDQLGGPINKKFLAKHFKELLIRIHQLPFNEQKQELEQTFEQWKNYSDKKNLTLKEIDNILLSLDQSQLLNRNNRSEVWNLIRKQENKSIENIISLAKEKLPSTVVDSIVNKIRTTNNQTDDVLVVGFKI